jgi:ATP-dependent DNA helicase RecG
MVARTPLRGKLPSQFLAFLPDAEPVPLAECLVAFANGDGGLIVLGLDEAGLPTESIWEDEAEGALREAAAMCRPPVQSEWRPVETGSDTLVGIHVPRSTEFHTLDDGRALIRRGPANEPLSGEEIQHLAAGKQSGSFESESVPGASRSDFDNDVLDEYLAKREARGASLVGSIASLLFEIGAVNHKQEPTVSGILLFGKKPQAFLPQCGIVFVKFAGTEPASEDGGAGYGRRDELNGPLARMVERAWNIVWEEMRVGARVSRLEREELTEYPRFAVREALINAVAHRDYRIRGQRIEIRMYADRLEVFSPGGLPGYITLDNLVEEHYSRNPRLVNGLFQWGYIEELGLGIDRMIADMVHAGHPPPRFRATPYSFMVTLVKAQEKKQTPTRPTSSEGLSTNERQQLALDYVREHGSISNSEYRRLCPGVSPETLRRDLASMVEKRLLLKIGSKKGTHYILK